MERFGDERFAIVGVNSDEDRDALRRRIADERITWRSFWDGGSTDGSISKRYGVRKWPTLYVLDRSGTIRFREVYGDELERAIETLLAE
ncbi:MAG: TlpA family protein disulfide reductase [Planctomycetes bacterium]|nr:TlpA family protein disulfide reductase [Planctomycetota bacterium]